MLLKLSEQTQGEPLVLMYLFKNTGETIVPSNIAEFIGTSSARVTSILNNLEDKGMISHEISRDDRRKILVSLTDKGRRTISALRTRSINRVSQVFQQMGEEKTNAFIDNWNLFLEIGKTWLMTQVRRGMMSEEVQKNKTESVFDIHGKPYRRGAMVLLVLLATREIDAKGYRNNHSHLDARL